MNKLLIYSLTSLLCVQASCAQAEISSFAELLVWHASEQPSSSWANVISSTEFAVENNDFGWDPGTRLGISYEPESFFQTTLYWTYFSTESSDKIPFGSYIVAPGFFSGFLSGNFFFGASTDWNLAMNTLDLEVSHGFNIADHISLTPFIGIKGAVINQTIDTIWKADIYNASEKVTIDFLGFGPSFGIGGQWDITKEFRFITDFSTAFLWGSWNTSDVYIRPYVPLSLTPEATEITTELDDSALGTLMLTYFVGLQWQPKALSQVTFQLGYEMQFWANQLRMTTFQQLPTHGDLTLQGGICGLTIDF